MTTRTRPQVAIFVDDLSATGVVRNAIAIANELQARGGRVELVATVGGGTLRATLDPAVLVTALLAGGADGWSRRQRLRRSFLAYRAYLKRRRSAVLLSAGNQGHLASAGASLGIAGLKLVLRISNALDHQSTSGSVPGLRRLKTRWIASRAERLVFVSDALARSWSEAGVAEPSKAVVIPNGVDVEWVRALAAEPSKHPWFDASSNVPVVLGIGRLVEQKNFSTLIAAAATAARERQVRLLLIGDGPLRERLLREAAELGDSFEIAPPVSNPMPYIAGAAVLALPSLWEGASNVLLEALACGTPVVASRTAGSAAEVLDGGRFGLLVDPGDARAMADALSLQLSSRPVLPGDRVLQFSRKAAVAGYADLLLSLADGG